MKVSVRHLKKEGNTLRVYLYDKKQSVRRIYGTY